MPAVGRPWPSGDNGDSGEIIIPPSPLLSLPWPSTLSSLDLLCRRFTLLLASCGALLFHDRVVDCRALLTVHRVAFLLVDCLALSVLQLGYVKTSTLQSSCIWGRRKKLPEEECRSVPAPLCTVVRLSLSISARSLARISENTCNQHLSITWPQSTFEFNDLFVDSLGDSVAFLLGALLALRLILGAAHPVLDRLTLLPELQDWSDIDFKLNLFSSFQGSWLPLS